MSFTILDVTAGGRMLWTDKRHPRTIYVDRRQELPGAIPIRQNWSVEPDVCASFTRPPFANESFATVLWDPPHIVRPKPSTGFMRTKYGELGPDWKDTLRSGFAECWRVLRPGGLLVLKWSGLRPSASEVLELFPARPLWKQKERDPRKIAGKAGITTDQAAAVLEAAGTTTWHHFEKPPADSKPVELPLFAAG